MQALTSLRTLLISRCELSGTVPQEVGSLSALTELVLANLPYLSGSLPAGLAQLSSLVNFDAHGSSTSNNILQDGKGLCSLNLTTCNLGGQLTCPLPATCNSQSGNPCLNGASSALHLIAANSQYLTVPTSYWFSSGAFTIEAWIFVNSFQAWSRLLDFSSGGASSNNVVFAISAGLLGTPVLQIYNGSVPGTQLIGPFIALSSWTHIAATVDASGNYKMFINGELVAMLFSQFLPANILYSSNYIGRSNWNSDGYFDGLIDNFMLWSVCRSPSQIWSSYMGESYTGSELGLQLYYKFDDFSGACYTANSCLSTGILYNGILPCSSSNFEPSTIGVCSGGNVTTLAPSSAPTADISACYNAVFNGYDCGGNDLLPGINVYDIASCANFCTTSVGCVGFAISLPINTSNNNNLCFLNTSVVANYLDAQRQFYLLGVCATGSPTDLPTRVPTGFPSTSTPATPTDIPTTIALTLAPTGSPVTDAPSPNPSKSPTVIPTMLPSTVIPTMLPSATAHPGVQTRTPSSLVVPSTQITAGASISIQVSFDKKSITFVISQVFGSLHGVLEAGSANFTLSLDYKYYSASSATKTIVVSSDGSSNLKYFAFPPISLTPDQQSLSFVFGSSVSAFIFFLFFAR